MAVPGPRPQLCMWLVELLGLWLSPPPGPARPALDLSQAGPSTGAEGTGHSFEKRGGWGPTPRTGTTAISWPMGPGWQVRSGSCSIPSSELQADGQVGTGRERKPEWCPVPTARPSHAQGVLPPRLTPWAESQLLDQRFVPKSLGPPGLVTPGPLLATCPCPPPLNC